MRGRGGRGGDASPPCVPDAFRCPGQSITRPAPAACARSAFRRRCLNAKPHENDHLWSICLLLTSAGEIEIHRLPCPARPRSPIVSNRERPRAVVLNRRLDQELAISEAGMPRLAASAAETGREASDGADWSGDHVADHIQSLSSRYSKASTRARHSRSFRSRSSRSSSLPLEFERIVAPAAGERQRQCRRAAVFEIGIAGDND